MKIDMEEFFNRFWNSENGEMDLGENKILVNVPIEIILKFVDITRLDYFLSKCQIEIIEEAKK